MLNHQLKAGLTGMIRVDLKCGETLEWLVWASCNQLPRITSSGQGCIIACIAFDSDCTGRKRHSFVNRYV
jgi:hypothetical protein